MMKEEDIPVEEAVKALTNYVNVVFFPICSFIQPVFIINSFYVSEIL